RRYGSNRLQGLVSLGPPSAFYFHPGEGLNLRVNRSRARTMDTGFRRYDKRGEAGQRISPTPTLDDGELVALDSPDRRRWHSSEPWAIERRAAEIVALHQTDAFAPQDRRVFLGGDAFGH